MKNLLSLDYWFNLRPEPLIAYAQSAFISLIAVLVLFAVIIFILKNRAGIYRGFLNRCYAFFLANALIGSIFLFSDYELVPFFSARFWLGLWAIEMLLWVVSILKKLGDIPRKKRELEQDLELKKYLP